MHPIDKPFIKCTSVLLMFVNRNVMSLLSELKNFTLNNPPPLCSDEIHNNNPLINSFIL